MALSAENASFGVAMPKSVLRQCHGSRERLTAVLAAVLIIRGGVVDDLEEVVLQSRDRVADVARVVNLRIDEHDRRGLGLAFVAADKVFNVSIPALCPADHRARNEGDARHANVVVVNLIPRARNALRFGRPGRFEGSLLLLHRGTAALPLLLRRANEGRCSKLEAPLARAAGREEGVVERVAVDHVRRVAAHSWPRIARVPIASVQLLEAAGKHRDALPLILVEVEAALARRQGGALVKLDSEANRAGDIHPLHRLWGAAARVRAFQFLSLGSVFLGRDVETLARHVPFHRNPIRSVLHIVRARPMLPILRSFKHPRRRVPDLAVIRRHKLVAVDPTGGGEPEDEHAEARVEPFRLIRFDKVRALLIIGRSCRRRAYLRHLDLPSVGIEEPELLHLHAVAALPHAEGHESIVEVRRFGIVWRRTAMVRPDGGEFPAPDCGKMLRSGHPAVP
eukprot:scaffold613_cov243-Pinguiococcus_pyrenoidosus.AAC.44